MKKTAILITVIAMGLNVLAQSRIGEWKDLNSFSTLEHVYVTPNRVYASTRMAMFYYDKETYATTPMTKVTGLSDAGVSTFSYDEENDCLVIAYSNSGVDFRRGSQVYHLPDIRRSSIGGDKKIYNIRFRDGKAYLACGFGIVVVDMSTYEIEDTYALGEGGDYGVVYDVAFTDSLIVAGTDNGYMYAPVGSSRLRIYDTWTRDTVSPMKGMSVRMLGVNRNWLVAAACTDNPDTLTSFFQSDNGRWGSWGSGHITSLRCHNGRIVLSRYSSVEVYSDNYQLVDKIERVLNNSMVANDADFDTDSTLWVAHVWAGLVKIPYRSSTAYVHCPEGPDNNDYVYSLTVTPKRLYLCPGGKKPTYEGLYMDGRLMSLAEGRWTNMSRGAVMTRFQDVLNAAVDPTDETHVSATAWGTGVLDIKGNTLQNVFGQVNTNNVLTPYTDGSYRSMRVSGLAYDNEGNLWVTNSLVDNGLVVRYHDGTWKAFNTSAMVQGNEIDKIIWDSVTGYKWFAGRANRIYVHDGASKMAYVDPNNGSKMETHTVACLVQDVQGDIWVGTDKGIKVIYDGYRAFDNGGKGEKSPVSCSNILYSDDGIYEYLMAYESVTCMAVDGANRKWVGTANNGLYLVSANGQEQLEHFTTGNSPLASDKIVTLAIAPESGIVYIGTDKGLQSYRWTATAAESEPASDIHAFPNPVRPEYDGPIAIKGFTRDALVHITDAAGHTVFTTQAYGGQAIWNGRNLQGEKVASGPYFVFASDAQGKMRSVTKILIIR